MPRDGCRFPARSIAAAGVIASRTADGKHRSSSQEVSCVSGGAQISCEEDCGSLGVPAPPFPAFRQSMRLSVTVSLTIDGKHRSSSQEVPCVMDGAYFL